MFRTANHSDLLIFTAVNYAVFDSDGNVHIGFTLKTYLKHHHITYDEMSRRLNMSLTGVSSMVARNTIDTGRLIQICESLKHDFFQYFSINIQDVVVREPGSTYEVGQAKKPKKLILEIEDNKVVSQRIEGEEDLSVEILKEMQRRQELLLEAMAKHFPELDPDKPE